MQQIVNEIGSEPADYNIEFLGVNWDTDDPGGNALISDGRDLPWLQDSFAVNAKALWGPAYRDLVVVGPRNEFIGVVNLTANDMALEINREVLKNLLLTSIAVLQDEDGDGLGDDWEDLSFAGDRSETPGGNRDKDTGSNFSEYVLGSGADDPASLPTPTVGIEEGAGGERYLTITFRRRLGKMAGLVYLVEHSADMNTWQSSGVAAVEVESINPYDGSGTVIVTCRAPVPIPAGASAGAVRVRALRLSD